MKYTLGIVLMAMAMVACNPIGNKETDYKTVRQEVMKFHDVVMADHGLIVGNQMRLDTLVKNLEGLKERFPELDTLKEKEVILHMIRDLSTAEDSMNSWMRNFEPDITGKSNEVAIQYFKDEKAKIAAVDSLYKKEIGLSDAYLERFKK